MLAAHGWDASPLSTARIAAELWEQIKNKDWSLVSRSDGMSEWAWRLWNFEKYYHHIGQSGSVGVGYSNPAAVGAALANRKYGRLSINLQNDGDFMFLPGTLWTAAHHKIPMLTVMHNNRMYNQEVMVVARMAAERNRDVSRCHFGNVFDKPYIDYAQLAQKHGMVRRRTDRQSPRAGTCHPPRSRRRRAGRAGIAGHHYATELGESHVLWVRELFGTTGQTRHRRDAAGRGLARGNPHGQQQRRHRHRPRPPQPRSSGEGSIW